MSRTILGNLSPTSPSREFDSDASDGPDNGEFDVALDFASKAGVKVLMRKSGADVNFRKTIKAIGGGAFSDQELRRLEERVLDKASWGDVGYLQGIEEGVPVVLSPRQKTTIDGLLRRLGDDPLATRVRGAYGDALRTGRVKIH